MLYVTVETELIEDKITNTSGYFDAVYETEWLNNDLAKAIIKGIDLSDHIKDNLIESPVFGGISPLQLSTGCKGVLLALNEPGLVLCGERFGDNCFYWLGKVGEVVDVHITIHHFLDDLDEDEDCPLIATITNSGKVVHTFNELSLHIFLASQGLTEDDI